MKIVLAPFGSRGDVEPMLALGQALRREGHDVLLCAPENFGDSVREHGFSFLSAGPDFRDSFDGTQNELKTLWHVFQHVALQFASLRDACSDADAVVGAMLQLAAPSVAEAYGIPYFYAIFSPCYLRSTELPPLGLPVRRMPAFLHRTLWRLQDSLVPLLGRRLIEERKKLGLRAPSSVYHHLAHSGELLVAVDPLLTPVPGDAGPHHLTGVWRLQNDRELPVELEEFLSTGPPPMYVGFGSMRHRNPPRMTDLLLEAMTKSGQRALISAGWSGLGRSGLPDSCRVIGEVPHDLLFPRVSAVIHHGGAGTTASAALAGVPQILVPHLGDQHYHGLRVSALGLGPRPITQRFLTADRLVRAIEQVVTDRTFERRARAFGEPMRRREGSRDAALLIERLATSSPVQLTRREL